MQSNDGQGLITDPELADIRRRAESIVTPWASTVLRLVAVAEEAERSRAKLRFADVLATQTAILIHLLRAGLDVRESNLDDRLLLDRIEDTIRAYRQP